MAERADWSDVNLRHFIDIFKGEIKAGFNRAGWENLVDKFEEKTGKRLRKKQLKSKWNNMRKEYTWFMELKNAAAGLGWDDAKQTVDCSKEWWDEHLARCNNPEKGIKCNHMRFQKYGPKHLDDLHIMFNKIHVSGTTASCPADISSDESSNDDDVTVVPKTSDTEDIKLATFKKAKPGKKKRKYSSSATEENDENSPFLRLYRNTCLKIQSAAEKITTSVEASSAPPTNLVPSIAETMKIVKGCGVHEKTALMHTSMSLIVKPEFREVFSSLETNKGRFGLLQREHEKHPTNLVPSIAEAVKMVKGCGVQEPTALMHTSASLIAKPEFREVFSLLETNEERFDLLDREHEKEMMNRI